MTLAEQVARIIKLGALDGTQFADIAERTIAIVREEAAKVAEKRRDERFAEHGTTERDTNASYYSGRYAETLEALDEEDEAIAAAIRKLGEKP